MKLYIITRSDLSPGQQAVQAAHALREFTAKHPQEDLEWYKTSNILVLLSVPDGVRLSTLLSQAELQGLSVASFSDEVHESWGLQLTAIAIGPRGKSLCGALPLALG